jgi:hypothetical protein
MTTARTQRFHVSRGGAARPVVAEPKPDDFTPVSAETFSTATFGTGFAVEAVEEVEGSAAFDPSTLDYDPADHTVDEVKAYVTENPEQADAILELELNGKGRSGLLSWLDNFNTENED